MQRDRAREAVVREALKRVAELGGEVVLGLGTGTTSSLFIEMLSQSAAAPRIRAVIPTSYQSEAAAQEAGFTCTGPWRYTRPDIYVDSFDQCDAAGNVIKGGGGAMVREKILMSSSRSVLLIGDEEKLVERLSAPIPIEVVPFAAYILRERLRGMGYRPSIRQAAGKAGPVISDNGNMIMDVEVGPVSRPEEMERELRLLPGVVEVGLCHRRGYVVLIGRGDGSVAEI